MIIINHTYTKFIYPPTIQLVQVILIPVKTKIYKQETNLSMESNML